MARSRNTPKKETPDATPVQEDLTQEDPVQEEEVAQEEVVETVVQEEVKVNKRTEEPKVPLTKTAPDKSSKDPFWLEKGDMISLDMKHRSMVMFPLPGGRIFRMNHRQWHAEIPQDISAQWLKALMLLFEQGDIVKGKEFRPKYPKNPLIMQKYQNDLNLPTTALIKKLKPLVIHKGLIEGYRSSEIIMALMRYEQEHMHRKAYIDLLNEALEHIGGTGPITQSPVENISMDKAEELEEDLT